jgi:hydrogenase expression/formation protein HypC
MCLAVPMRITSIDGQMATIELDGLTQRASLMLLPSAQVGDYVLVHAGCAITVLSEQEAQETIDLLGELAAAEEEMSEGGMGPAGDD